MNPDFLLDSALARSLYHTFAAGLPVIDYHNHLKPADLVSDRKYDNITQLWISADPYKHRAMRILGVEERRITGDADDYEKFEAWYESLPRLIGNPLFDWSRMELSRVMGVELLPFGDCKTVWDRLNEAVRETSAKKLLESFNVEYSAPCTALCDDLTVFAHDDALAPTLRGDDLLLPTKALLERLRVLTGITIRTPEDYLAAVEKRLDAFRAVGCRFSDHGLDNGFAYAVDDGRNASRFARLAAGEELDRAERLQLSSFILTQLASGYARHGFTMQIHIGAQRKTSTRLRTLAGAAGGYAAVGNTSDVSSLAAFLDAVESLPAGLPQVLLFPLNPADNAVMATLSGSFSRDGVEALVSQGPAWWWCDHYEGMVQMLSTFACHSVLSSFVGMTTDSRSLLSFVRHDYFRRVLCRWMAQMVESGRMPDDEGLLGDTIRRICYENAKKRLN